MALLIFSRSSVSSSRPSLMPLPGNPAYHAMLGPDDIINRSASKTAHLILVTQCACMRCVFVSNAYLQGAKYGEPPAMFSAAAERLGMGLDLMTYRDLLVPAGDPDALRRIVGEPDFVVFWDKDVRCAANLELRGLSTFTRSDCIRI